MSRFRPGKWQEGSGGLEFLGVGWGLSVSTSADLPDVCLCLPVTLPATIMTSSVPTTVGGHMMYPSPHAVMYAPTSGLADGSLTVLNAFSQAPSTMQVSHSQVQEQGESEQGCRKEDHFLPHTRTHTHTHSHVSPQLTCTRSHIPKPDAHTYTYMYTHTDACTHTRTTLTCTLDTFVHSPLGTYI